MDLREIRSSLIDTALLLLPAKKEGPRAVSMLIAIGMQETSFVTRRKLINKGGHGFWQMKKEGGIDLVLSHDRLAALAARVCAKRDVEPTSIAVWKAIEHDDILAVCMARLLLSTPSIRLPTHGDVDGAWKWYLSTWRPDEFFAGDSVKRAVLRERWVVNYTAALEVAN